jgi:stearoyl-CoA desaturase (delta-9 desaturase)
MFLMGLFIIPLYVSIPAIIFNQIFFVGFCGTVLFHRIVAHKNKINPIMENILVLLSWLGATSSAIAWAGAHRKHHRFSDTIKDPHSPIILGKFKAYWQLSDNNKDLLKYVPDLLKKNIYVFQHKHYFKVLVSVHILGIICLPFIYYWVLFIIPGFVMWFGGSLINIFCHDKTGPINKTLLGLLVGGEGFHKNHHEQPANPSFRHKFDWGGKIYEYIK